MVEGVDDEHVVKHLCAHYDIPHINDFYRNNGITQLLEGFRVRLKESQIETLGVLVDADTDILARWQSLRNILVAKGYSEVVLLPPEGGFILDPPTNSILPRVGIWLMPNNQTTGILEDFLRFLVPIGSKLFEHALKSVASIPIDERRFKELDLPKAHIHTWLAWQVDPGTPFGTAIKARFLNAGVDEARQFVDWYRRLYFPSSVAQ